MPSGVIVATTLIGVFVFFLLGSFGVVVFLARVGISYLALDDLYLGHIGIGPLGPLGAWALGPPRSKDITIE